MTRYEPHCDCLGGHVSMVPDPNGRWCRADAQRAVSDDPSGIVQQMPDGGDQALKPCPFCGKPPKIDNYGNGYYRIDHWCYDTVMDNFIAVEGERKSDVETRWNRRATEADLRAEVERLRAGLAGARVAAMKEAVSICKRVRHEIDTDEGAAGALEAALAILDAMKEPCCAALSPETDGGQDGA